MNQQYIIDSMHGYSAFTAVELEANRAGQFTNEQRQRLKRIAKAEQHLQKRLLIASLLFTFGIFLIGFFKYAFLPVTSLAFMLLLFPGVAVLLTYVIDKHWQQPLVVPVLLTAIGSAKKIIYSGRIWERHYAVKIGRVRFSVMPEFYNTIQTDRVYRFYYVPTINRNIIMSWENHDSTPSDH